MTDLSDTPGMNSQAALLQKYPFKLNALPFPYEALEPHIDATTMRVHHDKHHQTYVDKLNAALKGHPDLHKFTLEELLLRLDKIPSAISKDVRNNGGGHANHDFFWSVLGRSTAEVGKNAPSGALAKAISASFGSFDAFKEEFVEAGTQHFASGWVFLAAKPGNEKLEIFSLPNHATATEEHKVGLLINDVWEHAYYLKHQNERPHYLKAFWNVVDWDHVAQRWADASAVSPASAKSTG